MGLRLIGAKGVSAVSTWALKNVFRRPAANFPGKIALYIDPLVISDLASKLEKGSIVVCGTNGKTTVNNLLADVIEASGMKVVCNRTGANLDSGVATALLHAQKSDWGCFECDEMWVGKVLPKLEADYLLLLNLFRDQLDRVGEIQVVQNSIIAACKASPKTCVVYNADDPLCASIAEAVPNKSIAFGIGEALSFEQNNVIDAQMCQKCSSMLEYNYRHYDQLGDYRCSSCGFTRPELDYAARELVLGASGLGFDLMHEKAKLFRVEASYSGAYMIYNLLAVAAMSHTVACSAEAFQKALTAFNPQNGRLEYFEIAGHKTLLNLAKNPTGFNQNIDLITQDKGPLVAAFYVNDKEGDGRDVSWLWDIDFEVLASHSDIEVHAGGARKNDVQLRLKYAGINAKLIDHASEVFPSSGARGSDLPNRNYYFIANYTALPPVRAELCQLAAERGED
ncbi:MAG: MurT ligase domain-containing protein [Raoultibacter sp.]|jgi:UDP-N-acetylmuramyl tripeptide synthase